MVWEYKLTRGVEDGKVYKYIQLVKMWIFEMIFATTITHRTSIKGIKLIQIVRIKALYTVLFFSLTFLLVQVKYTKCWPHHVHATLNIGSKFTVTLTSIIPLAEYQIRKLKINSVSLNFKEANYLKFSAFSGL